MTKPADSHVEHARMERASGARYWITWVALIACIKAMLVVLFFMHLWDHGGANRLVFGTSVFFVVLLIGLVVLDNATRFPLANPGHDDATLRMEPPGPDILTPRA